MTTITKTSGRRSVVAIRRGETLLEIMVSIMVLGIGLVGILAAIPFGGFRMAQMTEADNSAAVGRNAARMLEINEWCNPASWATENPTDGNLVTYNDASLMLQDGVGKYLDSTKIYVIDPLRIDFRGDSGRIYPYGRVFSPIDGSTSGYSAHFIHVSPIPQRADGDYWRVVNLDDILPDWYEHIFYQQDDLITGYYASEDESEFRPRVEMEEKFGLGYNPQDGLTTVRFPDIPSFSGRYSWAAFFYPKSSDPFPDRCLFSSVVAADYDAVVFRDRILGDEKAFMATVDGSGYQGGTVTIDLSTHRDPVNNERISPSDNERISPSDILRVREQMAQTRYIMLVGPDDYKKPSGHGPPGELAWMTPTKARWYRIANFANVDDTHIRLTLIGPDTPVCWTSASETGQENVTAIFYPGAIGVYSGSTTF
ncbi:MAG: type II secretion system protein [Thermoguttaceae bacterium]|jgi:type II secretory pathway pseudopilin PulG